MERRSHRTVNQPELSLTLSTAICSNTSQSRARRRADPLKWGGERKSSDKPEQLNQQRENARIRITVQESEWTLVLKEKTWQNGAGLPEFSILQQCNYYGTNGKHFGVLKALEALKGTKT